MEFSDKNSQLIGNIVDKVKSHKKYKTIAEEVIIDEIKEYLRSNPNTTHIDKQLIKNIRRELHLSYASFQTKKKSKRKKYLEQLQKRLDTKLTNELLSMTLSTKERLTHYEELYKEIFKITGKPSSIIDLGCGFNPVSYPLMNIDRLAYYAYDIDKEDIKFLNEYFKIMRFHGLTGKAAILNIRNPKKISHLIPTDIIFLFNVLDIIDRKNHKPSEELIKQLIKKTKFIVASFATKTITRRPMRYPKRKWFELMLERLNFKFKIIETSNEIYYVVSK